jgi:hypothetical protein
MVFRNVYIYIYIYFEQLLLLPNILDDVDYYNNNWSRSKNVHFITMGASTGSGGRKCPSYMDSC